MSSFNIFIFITILVCAAHYVNGNLIKAEELAPAGLFTKDVKIPRDDAEDIVELEEKFSKEDKDLIDSLNMFDQNKKDCVPIGGFCVNHSDCCTNACLGYMRKCVSGSG